MIDINEEEIERLYGKLIILEQCIKIRKLGYEYPKNEYITIDMMCDMDGYGTYDPTTVIGDIIGPSLGDGYCCDTESVKDDIISLGGKIPYSQYDTDSIVGFTININNDDTKKFIKYNMPISKGIEHTITSIESDMCYDESTVDKVQLIIDYEGNSGFYIIVPEFYFMGDYFIQTYIEFLEIMRDEINQFEKEMDNKKEAA